MNSTKGLEHEIAYPKENDYHGHSNYFKTYIILLILFGLSLAASFIENSSLMLLTVFGLSTIKAALVVATFMHLKWEAKLIWLAVGVAVFIILAFFLGVFPDISIVEIDLAFLPFNS